jgi:hypothetical protein
MASMKANPLGELKMELVVNDINESSSLNLDKGPSFRSQVPVKEGLAAQDTFKVDAKKPSSRADLEKRRMHIDSGADLRGANMYDEFGGGTGGSASEFTSNKTK